MFKCEESKNDSIMNNKHIKRIRRKRRNLEDYGGRSKERLTRSQRPYNKDVSEKLGITSTNSMNDIISLLQLCLSKEVSLAVALEH